MSEMIGSETDGGSARPERLWPVRDREKRTWPETPTDIQRLLLIITGHRDERASLLEKRTCGSERSGLRTRQEFEHDLPPSSLLTIVCYTLVSLQAS